MLVKLKDADGLPLFVNPRRVLLVSAGRVTGANGAGPAVGKTVVVLEGGIAQVASGSVEEVGGALSPRPDLGTLRKLLGQSSIKRPFPEVEN